MLSQDVRFANLNPGPASCDGAPTCLKQFASKRIEKNFTALSFSGVKNMLSKICVPGREHVSRRKAESISHEPHKSHGIHFTYHVSPTGLHDLALLATSHASEGRIESCCLVHMRDASSAVMLCSQYRRHLPSAILRRGLLSDIRPAATRPKGMLSINRCSQPPASSPLLAPPWSDLVSGHCLKSSQSVVPCCFGLQGVLRGLVTLR